MIFFLFLSFHSANGERQIFIICHQIDAEQVKLKAMSGDKIRDEFESARVLFRQLL